MRINLKKDSIPMGSVVKLVSIGYTIGFGVIMIAATLFVLFTSLVSGDSPASSIIESIKFFIMTPIILVLQGLLVSVVVYMGIWVYKLYRPIEIRIEE